MIAKKIPTQQLRAKGQCYVGIATVFFRDGIEIIYVAPTAQDLAESLKQNFPNMEVDQNRFQKIAIFKAQ